MTEQANCFDTPLQTLLDLTEKVRELEARAHAAELAFLRYDEGILCLQWLNSRGMELYPVQLSEVAVYGATGREPGWLVDARKELGR